MAAREKTSKVYPGQRNLLENLPGVVYSCNNDSSWTMNFISDNILLLSGYPASDFLGNKVRSYSSIIHKSDRKHVWDSIQKAIENRERFTVEYRINTRKGKIKWVWEKGIGSYKGDDLIKLEGFIEDITDRKKIEDALRVNERKFRLIADNSIDCIWQLDRSLRFTYLSPSLYDITGYRPEEWIGTKLMEHTTWMEYMKMSRMALKMIVKYKTFTWVTFESRMFNKKGELIPVEIVGKPLIINDKLAGLQGSTRDIRNRTEAESRLIQSQNKFMNFIQFMPVAICNYNKDTGEILYMNEKFYEIFGYDKDDISTWDEWWQKAYPDPQYRKTVAANWSRILDKFEKSGSEISRDEYNVTCKNGEVKTVLIGGLTLDNEFIAILQNITQQKKAETELIDLKNSLQKKVKEQTSELKKRIEELERFNEATIEREFRMRELIDQIEELKKKK